MNRKRIAVLALFIGLICFLGTFYVVNTDEFAVVIRLGNVKAARTEPGLYFKAPLLDSLTTYSKRIYEYDAEPVAVVTSDKKSLVFDTVAIFRISDPELFYRRVRTVEAVRQRLDDAVYSAVRVVSGRMTLDDLVVDKRAETIQQSLAIAASQSKEYGVEILTIAFKRVFLPQDNEQAVYRSMQAERNRVAAQLRAEGQSAAVANRSRADRKETEILAGARKKAEQVKGEGDRIAQETIARATGDNKDLYTFMKTLEFYASTLEGTPMLIAPDSGILKYLRNSEEK